MIELRTLGPVDVMVDGAPAPPDLLWRKNLALLIYLARSPRRSRSRDHLIGLLWGDRPESAARHSLSEALRVLRRHLGDGAIDTNGGSVRLAQSAIRLDCDEFDARIAAGEWAGAAGLVAGEFLEGFGVADASEFESWLTSERSAWRRRGVEALVRGAEAALAAGDLVGAAAAAERAVALGPTADAAARALMRCRALAGDRAGALAVYDTLAATLRADVGTAPEAETERLAERVRRERVWRVSGGTAGRAASAAPDSRRAPLVGREPELGRLLEAWGQCRDRPRATLCLVTGDMGAGRTRLLEELVARARLDGAAVTATRAVEGDAVDAGAGVFALARGGLLEARGIAAAPAAALAVFAARIPEWADRFPAARGAAPDPASRALVDILRAAGEEQPVVMAVDDAQWLDRDSLLALESALRDLATAPVLIVLAAGEPPPAPIDDLRARLGREVAGVRVRVGPLGRDALRTLACRVLPDYDDDALDRVTRRVLADSAGLPLLAVELLHAVALGLDLRGDAGTWPAPLRTLDQTMPGDLPDAVVGAIRVGFRRLTADAQRVLAAAAVHGGRVPAGVLGRMTGLGAEPLAAALDELEWQRWLVADPRGYDFVARIVRVVIERDMVTPGQRERLRQAMAAD